MRISGRWNAKDRAAGLLLSLLLLTGVPAMARERKVVQKKASAPVDPQNRAADAWLDQTPGSTTANHGSDTTLQVRSFRTGGVNQNQRSLVEFDLSAFPSSGIKLATLSLFMSTAPGVSRTYNASRMTSLWTETGATWANRVAGTAWTLAGGDFAAATTTTATGTTNNVFLNWVITADVQQWFGSTTPVANYGTTIMDATENSATARTAIFSSKENATEANHPSLTIEYVPNVKGLSATAGNAQNILNWTYPPEPAVTGATVLSPRNGVLIIRQPGTPIPATVAPTDGTVYTATGCPVLSGTARVVWSSNTSPTTFNDSAAGDNPNCPPVNDTIYYYKVFAKDAANNYSHNSGNFSIFIPLITATPSATVANRQAAVWLAATGSGGSLAAPGIIPGNVVVVSTNSSIVHGVNPSDGTPVFTPVTMGGAIAGRPPVLEGDFSSIAHNVAYTAGADGFVYAVDAANGDLLWMTNPTGLTTNGYTSGPGVLVKASSGVSYTRATDLVVVGTRNAASTTTNRVSGIDGNTGATAWQLIGNSGGNPAMDIVAATPFVDYVNSTVWVTSLSAGGVAQPSLWKINANDGTRLATANLGNISNSPFVTVADDTLFVGNDAGTLYAINPATAATRASFAAGDTRVVGSPVVMNFTSPYTVIFSGATTVKAVIYTAGAATFTTAGPGTWSTALPGGCAPSAPLGYPGFNKIYVGCTLGHLYQLDVATGAVDGNRVLDTGSTIGDPTLDVVLSRIMAGSSDSRVYAFTYPF